MSVKEVLSGALKEAMRAGDETRKRTLRGALTAIKLAEVQEGAELDDTELLRILQKEVKSRHETIADATRAGRPELGRDAEAEIAILEAFLPRPLSPDELEKLARQAIAQVGAVSPGDVGRVMKELMPLVRGRADGGEVNRVVRQLLSDN